MRAFIAQSPYFFKIFSNKLCLKSRASERGTEKTPERETRGFARPRPPFSRGFATYRGKKSSGFIPFTCLLRANRLSVLVSTGSRIQCIQCNQHRRVGNLREQRLLPRAGTGFLALARTNPPFSAKLSGEVAKGNPLIGTRCRGRSCKAELCTRAPLSRNWTKVRRNSCKALTNLQSIPQSSGLLKPASFLQDNFVSNTSNQKGEGPLSARYLWKDLERISKYFGVKWDRYNILYNCRVIYGSTYEPDSASFDFWIVDPRFRIHDGCVGFTRPLLHLSRATITRICRDLDLPVYPDRSNRSLYYSRNRIREQVLPTLKLFFNPRVEESFFRFAEIVNKEKSSLNRLFGAL